MPIGNGLTCRLPKPVPVSRALRIELWNDGLLRNRLVDQVEVNGQGHDGNGPGKEVALQPPLPSEPDVILSYHPAQADTKPRASGAGITTVECQLDGD